MDNVSLVGGTQNFVLGDTVHYLHFLHPEMSRSICARIHLSKITIFSPAIVTMLGTFGLFGCPSSPSLCYRTRNRGLKAEDSHPLSESWELTWGQFEHRLAWLQEAHFFILIWVQSCTGVQRWPLCISTSYNKVWEWLPTFFNLCPSKNSTVWCSMLFFLTTLKVLNSKEFSTWTTRPLFCKMEGLNGLHSNCE